MLAKDVILAISPVIQTGIWVGFIVWALTRFRVQLDDLLQALIQRIRDGSKLITPFGTIESSPDLPKGRTGAATAEGSKGGELASNVRAILEKKQFPDAISESIYLVHASEVIRPRTEKEVGLFRVRVWMEAYTKDELKEIKQVSYRLFDDDFPEPVISTAAMGRNFEIWLNVYGEFTIIAYAERQDGTGFWLTRYLDLPGRPPE